jgi:hypothetical protein
MRDVRAVVIQGRIEELLSIARTSVLSAVKLRQLGTCLVHLGLMEQATSAGLLIENKSEVTGLIAAPLARVRARPGEREKLRAAVDALGKDLRPPQTRVVQKQMDRLGIARWGRWTVAVPEGERGNA